MGWVRRYRWWVVSAAAVVVVGLAVAAAWVWWPERESDPAPLVRPYLDFDVCVLVPGLALADPQAAAVWAGVVKVSRDRGVRAQHLAVVGEQSAQRAGQFLATLVQQGCEVIVAVGAAPVAAVAADEAKYPGLPIVAVGDEVDGTSIDSITSSTVEVLSGLVPVA